MSTIGDDIEYCLERGDKAIKKSIENGNRDFFYYGLDKYEKTGIILNNTIRKYSDDEVVGEVVEIFPIIKKIASFNNVEVCTMPSFIAHGKPYQVITKIHDIDNLYEIENSSEIYIIYTIIFAPIIEKEQRRILLRYAKCIIN